jgi:glyoxylase-like metal-dependent hydrolase (beta-lactamase superfamily II)
MRLSERIHLVGSGAIGLSHAGDCHVYLLDAGGELALIDAGCGEDTQRLLDNAAADGLDPRRIRCVLLTHAHRDHAGGCANLRRLLGPGLRIVASAAEARLLAAGSITELGLDLLGLAHLPREESFPPCDAEAAADGQLLAVGDLAVRAIEVPGHNPGCLCYLTEVGGRRALFSGDVVHHGGVIGLGNWPGVDLQAYRRSLRKLAGLRVEALLSGHLLWTIAGGQVHIDKALAAFEGLWPPVNINRVEG